MYKTDKRLMDNHLTEEEKLLRAKQVETLKDVDDKAEQVEIEFEEAGLLKKLEAKKIQALKDAEENEPDSPHQDL